MIVGVRADGTKELVAVADGTRESTDDWAELLRDLRRRGMGAPVVMVGDGALGLWRALREVFPATREQRCWVHKVANVLNALPKSVQAGARRALNEIAQAEDRTHAERAIQALVSDYGAKWPNAGHQGTGQQGRRAGDGVQAAGGGRAAVAGGQRPPPGRAGPGGGQLRERQAGRATQGGARREDRRGRRVIMQGPAIHKI